MKTNAESKSHQQNVRSMITFHLKITEILHSFLTNLTTLDSALVSSPILLFHSPLSQNISGFETFDKTLSTPIAVNIREVRSATTSERKSSQDSMIDMNLCILPHFSNSIFRKLHIVKASQLSTIVVAINAICIPHQCILHKSGKYDYILKKALSIIMVYKIIIEV